MTKYRLLASILALVFQTISAQNLLNNGDFESGGNGVGFSINSSFYNNINPPYSGTTSPGNYSVTTNPQLMNTGFFLSGGDHTTGSGNMLVVDATTTGGSQRFWRAGNNGEGICNLTVGSTYTFSYWIKSVSIQVTGPASQANIGYQIIGANNITLVSGSATAPLPAAGWQQVVYTFTATNNCVNIELWDNNTAAIGNDFAVDDFSLVGPPLPFTLGYATVSLSCIGSADGAIIGYGAGGNPPYVYSITGPVSANNSTGVFAGLPAGTYTLHILEGADGEITIPNIVLSEPQQLLLNSPTSICQGASTVLSVSGSNSGYQWTSSPVDPDLNTTAASQQVHPTQTTTYTVSSSQSGSRNLVYNSDFSLGNQGFKTQYNWYSPNNPSGAQRAYGIVNNAQSWESGFSACTDHTGNNGLMMVVDGSPQNSGNDRVWTQTVPVQPNQNYTFSYWVQTVALPSPANLEVTINGVSVGIAAAPSVTCQWVNRSYNWNSGSNTVATLVIYDRNTALNGNDFALDDLSFTGPQSTCTRTASVTITVNPTRTPDFPTVLNICSGASVPVLSTTAPNGITGTWVPASISNTSSNMYTFTPDAGQCAEPVQLSVTVNNGQVTPTFATVGPYCAGTILSNPLPNNSQNGITGQWTPSFNNSQTTTYTFTPDAGQCAAPTSVAIVIDPPINPVFTQAGPFCAGENISDPLPLLSENGITGHWEPLFNNLETTNYTFVPDPGQCANTALMTVVINPKATPLFAAVSPICSGGILNPLPTTSLNNISGTWTPAPNNQQTTTYTFTPDADQCAVPNTLEVVVSNDLTPTFDFENVINACYRPVEEGPSAPLPLISNNGISGVWNPPAINYSVPGNTLYTFTPNDSSCSAPFVLSVNITEVPAFIIEAGCVNENFVLSSSVLEMVQDSHFTWYNEQNEIIGTESSVVITNKGTYKVVKEINGCRLEQTITVTNVNCKIPKGISPNDDQLNDFFDLSNLDVKQLKIFNRYGTEVYSKSPYQKEWDGKANNGHYLPDGTYYYLIDFESGKSKTGWVYLIREH